MYIYNNECNMTEQYKIVIFQYHWYSVYNNNVFFFYLPKYDNDELLRMTKTLYRDRLKVCVMYL